MVHLICDADTGAALDEEGDADARFSPCSTFKLPIALMGFDSGILENAERPVWDYRPEYGQHVLSMLDFWKKPYTPSMWMQNSCVWYSQQVTQRLGPERFQSYVRGFGYGNQDISGDPGKDNGLLRSWLTSSLAISPRGQVDFLRRMLSGALPVPDRAVEMTRALAAAGDGIFGKTGSGYLDLATGKQRGWYVGWMEAPARRLVFAGLVDYEGPGFAGQQAREFMRARLARFV